MCLMFLLLGGRIEGKPSWRRMVGVFARTVAQKSGRQQTSVLGEGAVSPHRAWLGYPPQSVHDCRDDRSVDNRHLRTDLPPTSTQILKKVGDRRSSVAPPHPYF